jgi:hypothetical protein
LIVAESGFEETMEIMGTMEVMEIMEWEEMYS